SLSSRVRVLHLFFFNAAATPDTFTLSLHDALPILVADFRMPPQVRQGGSSSPAATRASARSMGARSPQSRQATSRVVPWISTTRSEEHTSELQSRENLVCRLLLEKKNITVIIIKIC